MEGIGGNRSGHARLVAVGDVMLGDSAGATGYGFASRYAGVHGAQVLSRLGRLFGDADVVFGNLEGSLSQVGHSSRKWSSTQFRGYPAYGGALREAGFRVMSVANNHASQHGEDAFADTVHILRDAGIECCGVPGSAGWCSEPVILRANAVRLGFLAYCLRPRQYSSRTPPYAEGTIDQICNDIDRLRHDVDYVVTSLHWGEEFVARPSVREVRSARKLSDAGSAVIIGHHPHVLRPVERASGSVIGYSLGNFVSDMIWYEPLRSGLMLTVDVSGDVMEAMATPLWIDDSYLPIVRGEARRVEADQSIRGLDPHAYSQEVTRTVRENRIASYVYALRNVRRFRSPTLRHLIAATVRAKASALRQRVP